MQNWPDLSTFQPAISGFRPERKQLEDSFFQRLLHTLRGIELSGFSLTRTLAEKQLIKRVNGLSAELMALSDKALSREITESRHALRRNGFMAKLVARNFAIIREVSYRTVGKRHYDTQLIGGWLLLKGVVAEMPTGEGKTLVASLAASTAAMAGLPVHVLTVNDYLTERDAHEMKPIYQALGLSLGYIINSTDNSLRHDIYKNDIVYVTSKEIVFDYLRDRIVLGKHRKNNFNPVEAIYGNAGCYERLLMRGLHFAIVDEADSILIDEARTPLIISGAGSSKYTQNFLLEALEQAEKLLEYQHYKINQAERTITLTQEGEKRIEVLCQSLGSIWSGRIRREESITQALSALHLFHRDEHYLIRDEKVEIIDQLTGRVTKGRAWERGLHQLIELKEGIKITEQRDTLARISYQSFFRRYLHLSGMTGTAKEVQRELWQVFGLSVIPVPYNKPCIRKQYKTKVFVNDSDKWQAIAEEVHFQIEKGRSVLVGTASVAASEQASEVFSKQGLNFKMLNAKQDQQEAEVIMLAGYERHITIATSMAGRGTDIKLEQNVRQSGGLHVILSEHFDSARVDRQLAGRCARQGDPGSFSQMLSLQDVALSSSVLKMLRQIALFFGVKSGTGRLLALAVLKMEQKNRERRSFKDRQATRKYAQSQDDLLSISGISE